MGILPGALAFGRDMILNIPIIADLELLRQRRQVLIDRNLVAANSRRISYDYQPNDQVLIRTIDPDKLEEQFIGPFLVLQVHTNGTVTIQCAANVTERINIRRLKPYRT